MTLHASSLVLLESIAARRLAVAWQFLGEDRGEASWAAVAGVPTFDARRFGAGLKASDICRADGTTDPLALNYIGAVTIPASMKKPRGKE